jgi:hypothetical protein
MRRNMAFVVAVLLALSVSACAKTEARVVVTPPPPLDVPPPPPRMVEPVLADLPPEEVDATAQAAAAVAPRPAPQPPSRPRAEASRPEAAETQAPELAKPSPSATLQTVPPSREGQMQRSIRVHLDGAIENLNRVDYSLLGAEGRANFEQARRFIAQAEGALAAKNLVFAATVADKAATLAAQLAGR